MQDFLAAHGDIRNIISARVSGLDLGNPTHLDTAREMIASLVGTDPTLLDRSILARWWEAGQTSIGNVMQSGFDAILPARHPSQLYEALLEGLVLFIICWTIGRLWRKEGMASGAFLTLYPIMRIIGEQFRVGDSPRKVLGVEMSLGVFYSLLMFIGGAIYWAYWIRKNRGVVWEPVAASPPPDQAAAETKH